MKAISKGAGKNTYILGFNQPMWPSLGLVTGSRSSMDISIEFENMQKPGSKIYIGAGKTINSGETTLIVCYLKEILMIINTCFIHRYYMLPGGALLSGDDISTLPAKRIAILKKMVNVPGITAEFNSDHFDYGWITNDTKKQLVVLNWQKMPKTFRIPI